MTEADKAATASELADDIIDSVVDRLREDPSILPRKTRFEWELTFANLRNRFEIWIGGVIEEAIGDCSMFGDEE
jgi:hypothetical protein